jgi:hypothetical protein
VTLARSLKVHLRVLDVLGTTLRVATLRPQTATRFSTNYFHDTWHVLGGADAPALFGRLLWGLAFQRLPGTLFLIDAPHLVPTPFEADPPDPILLIPEGLTPFDPDLLRALAVRLRRAPGPPATIRWHAFGLEAALERDERDDPFISPWRPDQRARYRRERMTRTAGFICYTAPPDILREQARAISRMRNWGGRGDYHYLAENNGTRRRWRVEGELQLIPGFADQVSAAVAARREVLGGGPDRALASEDEREAVYARKELALRRLTSHRRGC